MDVTWHPVPAAAYIETGMAVRAPFGVVLHNTETDGVAWPTDVSWHYEIDRAGAVHGFVPEADVAFHVRASDRWNPAWLPLSRPWNASPANCHTIGVELVSSQKWRNQGRPYTSVQVRALQALLLDLRSRYGGLPVVGHGHVQADRSDPVWFDWAAALTVLPETDAVMPLEGASRSNPLLGGYAFAERQDDGVYHCGVDLNAGLGGDADLGAPVRAPADATVAVVLTDPGGYGRHVWLKADDGHWLHTAHHQRVDAAEGQRLKRGESYATCGKSGGWAWAHVHWEVLYDRPGGWSQWPSGWSKARVLETYMDPFGYLAATWPAGTPGGGGTVDEPLLDDAELAWKLQPQLWGEHFHGEQIDWAIPARWRAEFRLGNQLGRPLGPELDVPDVAGARYQEFEDGRVIVYRDGKTSLIG